LFESLGPYGLAAGMAAVAFKWLAVRYEKSQLAIQETNERVFAHHREILERQAAEHAEITARRDLEHASDRAADRAETAKALEAILERGERSTNELRSAYEASLSSRDAHIKALGQQLESTKSHYHSEFMQSVLSAERLMAAIQTTEVRILEKLVQIVPQKATKVNQPPKRNHAED